MAAWNDCVSRPVGGLILIMLILRNKSQVVSLQIAHSWANAGVMLGDACISSGVAFEAIILLG